MMMHGLTNPKCDIIFGTYTWQKHDQSTHVMWLIIQYIVQVVLLYYIQLELLK